MNVKEFYERLSQVDSPRMLRLAPGPLSLRVGEADALAAKLLLWLEGQMPDDATFGDLDDVLDAAKWWTTFWVTRENAALASERVNVPESESAE